MRNDHTNAIEIMSKHIISTCQKLIDKANFAKVIEGIISDKNESSYTVSYADNKYIIRTTATNLYSIGEKVKICIPNGNRNKTFIIMEIEKVASLLNN